MGERVENTVGGVVVGHLVQAGRIDRVVLPSASPQALFGLPPDPPEFVGRGAELATLLDARLSVLSGLPGVGKTALAVHAAHCFGGDVLFVNLHGYDPDDRVEPTVALETFLRALGVSSEHIPPDLASREILYRTLLAKRDRMLIVLDNVVSIDQITPLLADRHTVLITSRHRLADLPGARQVELAVLTTDEAVSLVTTALAQRRGSDDRVGTPELAHLCGRLPLALSIAAAILADDPALSVAELVDLLRESSPLEELQYGDSPGVRAAFDLSYVRLTEEERRVFVSFAAHVVTWLTVESAAAMNDLPITVTRRALRSLQRAHLVESAEWSGWFTLHDLLGGYVRTLVLTEWTSDMLDGTRQRFLEYLGDGLEEVSAWLGGEPPADSRWPDATRALDWVRRENFNIICGVGLTGLLPEWHLYASSLTYQAIGYVFNEGDWDLGGTLFESALMVGEQLNDSRQQAEMLILLGKVDQLQYDPEFGADQARSKFVRAARLVFAGEAHDLKEMVFQLLRDVIPQEKKLAPEDVAQRVMTVRAEPDAPMRAQALLDLGDHYRAETEFAHAVDHYRAAIEAARGLPVDPAMTGTLLSRIGTVEFRLARYEDARASWIEAIAEFEAAGRPTDRLRRNLTVLPAPSPTSTA